MLRARETDKPEESMKRSRPKRATRGAHGVFVMGSMEDGQMQFKVHVTKG